MNAWSLDHERHCALLKARLVQARVRIVDIENACYSLALATVIAVASRQYSTMYFLQCYCPYSVCREYNVRNEKNKRRKANGLFGPRIWSLNDCRLGLARIAV